MTDARRRDPRPYYDRLPFPKASRFELDAAVNGDTLIDLNRPNASRAEYDRRILLVTLTSAAAEADTLRSRVAALEGALEVAIDLCERVGIYGRLNRADPAVPGPMEKAAAVAITTFRAALAATPAPATDEARCGFAAGVSGPCNSRPADHRPCWHRDADHRPSYACHPFQPTPTPATDEARCEHEVVTMTEYCPDCGSVHIPGRGWTQPTPEPAPCGRCGHQQRFHADDMCDCEGNGEAGLCDCTGYAEPAP